MSADDAALEAAWRLGGRDAVKVLLANGETRVCPLCEGTGLPTATPTFSDGKPRSTCELCDGCGGIRRAVAVHRYARTRRDLLVCWTPP